MAGPAVTMRARPSVLFLSYDGLTDPLGQSQILPYLLQLAPKVQLHILSFEKTSPKSEERKALEIQLRNAQIGWTPLRFTARPRLLAKVWDLGRMVAWGLALALTKRCKLVHCRSYVAAQVGVLIKVLTGARLLFDMRGFWVDERVDSGNWNQQQWIYRGLFQLYKKIENVLFARADHIVSLTEAAVPTLQQWLQPKSTPITVIPCCADFEHFSPRQETRLAMREQMGFAPDHLVLCYLGSLGSWYQLPEMLSFFALLRRARPKARFLLLTRDWGPQQEALVQKMNLSEFRSDLTILSANRAQVADYLQVADLAVSFIRCSFSKTASSPTKMAEVLALGIPIVCNGSVGDVSSLMARLKAGCTLETLEECALQKAVDTVDETLALGGPDLRHRARQVLALEVAAQRYTQVYSSLLEL